MALGGLTGNKLALGLQMRCHPCSLPS
jgi:hypothetical protein